MPTYVYQCPAREGQGQCAPFERRRPIAEYKDPAECPHCGELAPKVLGQVAVEQNIIIPGHFQLHVSQVKTKEALGPGPWQELNRKLARWNGRY